MTGTGRGMLSMSFAACAARPASFVRMMITSTYELNVRIESSKVSPLTSDDVDGSRISLVRMPKIWHALLNDRKVRVEGCVKYSIARRVGSRSRNARAPTSDLASARTREARSHSSSSSARSNTCGSMTWNSPVPRVGRTSVSVTDCVGVASYVASSRRPVARRPAARTLANDGPQRQPAGGGRTPILTGPGVGEKLPPRRPNAERKTRKQENAHARGSESRRSGRPSLPALLLHRQSAVEPEAERDADQQRFAVQRRSWPDRGD